MALLGASNNSGYACQLRRVTSVFSWSEPNSSFLYLHQFPYRGRTDLPAHPLWEKPQWYLALNNKPPATNLRLLPSCVSISRRRTHRKGEDPWRERPPVMIPNPPILRPSTSTIAYMLALVLSLLLCAPGYTEALQNSIFDHETLIDRSDTSGLLYEPNFAPFDRSIIGRAQADQPLLTNNGPDSRSIIPGGTVCYVVDKKTLFGDDKRDDADGLTDVDMESGHQNVRRAKTKTVYISANTCSRPTLKSKDKNGKFESTPQISLYTSTTSKVKCPTFGNYNKSNPDLKKIPFMEGAVTLTMNATDDIYISVVAPNLTQKYDGEWSYQVAISLDEYYHNYDAQNGTARLLLMDSDSTSALLVTSNLTQDSSKTQQIMKTPPPYQIFVGDEKSRSIDGLRHSACGLTRSAEIWANGERTGRHNDMVTTGVTTRGPGKLPKQQFLIAGLNHSTTYSGILVKMPDKNSKRDTSGQTIGGGGTIYRATTFQTSSSKTKFSSRLLKYNLTFHQVRTARWLQILTSATRHNMLFLAMTKSSTTPRWQNTTMTMPGRCMPTLKKS